jgi:hypothetical protein
MPSARYVHPEFGYFCPTPRFRRRLRVLLSCMIVGGIGFAVLRAGQDLTAAHSAASGNAAMMARAEIAPEAARTSDSAALGLRPALNQGLKTSCEEDTWAYLDGKCVAGKERKPRMVRVPTNRPALATIPLGRGGAPAAGAAEPASTVAAADGRKGDFLLPKAGSSAQADVPVAAAVATEPSQQAAAAPRKPQRTAHSQNRRREREVHPGPAYGYASVPDQRYGGGGGFFFFR